MSDDNHVSVIIKICRDSNICTNESSDNLCSFKPCIFNAPICSVSFGDFSVKTY